MLQKMKTLYILLLLIVPFLVKGQSFTYQSNYGLSISGKDSFTLCDTVTIINVSGHTFNVMCRINHAQMTSGHAKYFCFGAFCYDTSVTIAANSVLLKNGWTADLKAYAVPQHIIGSDDVTYQIYDSLGASDTLAFTIHYEFSLTAVNELSHSASLNKASPNPANQYTAVSYHFSTAKDARLV